MKFLSYFEDISIKCLMLISISVNQIRLGITFTIAITKTIKNYMIDYNRITILFDYTSK